MPAYKNNQRLSRLRRAINNTRETIRNYKAPVAAILSPTAKTAAAYGTSIVLDAPYSSLASLGSGYRPTKGEFKAKNGAIVISQPGHNKTRSYPKGKYPHWAFRHAMGKEIKKQSGLRSQGILANIADTLGTAGAEVMSGPWGFFDKAAHRTGKAAVLTGALLHGASSAASYAKWKKVSSALAKHTSMRQDLIPKYHSALTLGVKALPLLTAVPSAVKSTIFAHHALSPEFDTKTGTPHFVDRSLSTGKKARSKLLGYKTKFGRAVMNRKPNPVVSYALGGFFDSAVKHAFNIGSVNPKIRAGAGKHIAARLIKDTLVGAAVKYYLKLAKHGKTSKYGEAARAVAPLALAKLMYRKGTGRAAYERRKAAKLGATFVTGGDNPRAARIVHAAAAGLGPAQLALNMYAANIKGRN